MNKAKLKSYAPAARRDFIQAVSDRAHFFGISEKEIVSVEESGDVAIIGGRPFPRAVAAQRRKLDARVKRDGFSQVMEAVAYTWFNRFLALRYMELHGYLEHGFRVLSNTGSSTTPEILDHAAQLDLPGLNKQKVTELKLDGNKDAELYRILLVAQCNSLHSVMPFLFEKIEDETELLLPDNLLHSDSLIRKLVTEIEEDDWQEVEIIGWLYQFYISEKKDQVIGKVVKSEDIPAATQLFTPNWIVKYMVQNSLGRQWLATYPSSTLRSKMEYFITPAEQNNEVKAMLSAMTPESLDPEKLTLLDPACGSGHILVEAYDVFKEIYLERGYSNRDFPKLILEKNLYGLDIDDRAAQMAGFALLMKARKDDRRILQSETLKLNVMSIQESVDIKINNDLWGEYSNYLRDIVDLFKHGKTFGSLIQVPKVLATKLIPLEEIIKQVIATGDLYEVQAAWQLLPLLKQAKVLGDTYDCIVANPPYMGGKGMPPVLKNFAISKFPKGKSDLFAVFMERGFTLCKRAGFSGMVTMQSWMFLSSYEELRDWIVTNTSIDSLLQIGYNSFPELNSKVAQACSFVIRNAYVPQLGSYFNLNDAPQSADKHAVFFDKLQRSDYKIIHQQCFKYVPGTPIAHWISDKLRDVFANSEKLGHVSKPRQGLASGDNERFMRFWFEVSYENIGFNFSNFETAKISGKKWFPHNKGGEFRKWFGNNELVLAFDEQNYQALSEMGNHLPSRQLYFKEGMSWTALTSGSFNGRHTNNSIFDAKGPVLFANKPEQLFYIIAFCNSSVATEFLRILAPTLDFNQGPVGNLPIIFPQNAQLEESISDKSKECIRIAKCDWNSREISFGFESNALILNKTTNRLVDSVNNCKVDILNKFRNILNYETEISSFFIDLYGLSEELPPLVKPTDITIYKDEIIFIDGQATIDISVLIRHFFSFAIGCMMGRYSLDKAGVVYANSENLGFLPSQYQSFSADDDGIVPVMDMDWFPDDASNRFEEFLKAVWSLETLEENLKFVADILSPKGGETPRETIRRYISSQFYKDHLQTYKKRPIYWLFSSGKQRAFECLVYLHRYNESTLSRMRNEYVTPLQGKFSAQADYLSNEINAAASTAERNRLQKQLDTLRKKQVELASFDDLLRHYADQRINLDLDDGVKVNYGKFGALLAEVKAVTGGSE
jgi:hypothetical protein